MSKKMTLDRLAIITMKAFDAVDKRFNDVDKRFNDVDKRFDGIDSRLDGIDRRLDHHADYYVSYFVHEKLAKRVEKLEKTSK